MQYKFYDTDFSGRAEYDISGDEYFRLIKKCFEYSYSISFLVNVGNPTAEAFFASLEKYRLPVTDYVKSVYGHYAIVSENSYQNYEIRHYLLSDEVKHTVYMLTDSVFKWINGWGYQNPEDPAFFREDGSVFFCSSIHNGECTLMPNGNEDIGQILCNGLWFSDDLN